MRINDLKIKNVHLIVADYPKKTEVLGFPINKITLKLTMAILHEFSCLPSELKKMSLNPVNLLICFQTKKKRLYLHPLSRNNYTV